ncbi:MAG TPA: hypothetical protein VIJ84_06745 [Gaiellaceae bacterium]
MTTKPWCQAKRDAAWKKALGGGLVTLSRRASVQPLAVADDGHSFYATLFSKSYSGIVEIDARTSRYTTIRRVPHVDAYGALGSADGRWLVWADTTTNYWTKWKIWSWDSRTGRLRRVAETPRAADAADWSAVSTPSVRDGYAVWAQGIGSGKTGVHVVDLASGKNKIIYRGRASEPFLLPGRVVVWTEDVGDFVTKNPDYVLRAANAVSGKRVALPAGVRDLSGYPTASLVSDGSGYLYTTDSSNWLWWSPSLGDKASRVFRTRYGGPLDNSLAMAGRYVFFSDYPFAYFADTHTGRYLQISAGGSVLFGSKSLVLSKPAAVKASHGIADVAFLPLASLPPIPPCR